MNDISKRLEGLLGSEVAKSFTLLGDEIKEAEQQRAELTGQIKEIERQLREEFECKDIDEVEKMLTDIAEKRAALQKRVQDQFAELEAMYAW